MPVPAGRSATRLIRLALRKDLQCLPEAFPNINDVGIPFQQAGTGSQMHLWWIKSHKTWPELQAIHGSQLELWQHQLNQEADWIAGEGGRNLNRPRVKLTRV